jgi:AcrR family transcriptional regulator
VSIGTLYQFFSNKEALLDTLADQELTTMAKRVMQIMQDATFTTTESRVTGIVRAVAATYGNRRTAHKVVMAHSLMRGENRLSPLLAKLVEHLSTQRDNGAIRHAFDRADAFVLAHSFAGVLRAMIDVENGMPPQDAIESSLARMVLSFVGSSSGAQIDT